MDTVDLKLAQDCESLAVAASEGVGWLKDAADQSPTVAQQAPSLISELQKVRNQSRKLARAARRRMCVGVFGPSQAGKSYLVSILASRDGRPLQARFGDKSYDFLREINPPGNRESTGLVTRFGLGLSDGDADFPVRVRLLTQTDIVKILGNSFLLDFDHQKAAFERPDGARDPQAPGRAARAQAAAQAARRPRFRRRARPDRVFRHLLRRRHRRAAHRILARGDRAGAAPVGPRPRPAVVGAVVRLPALHRSLPDALRRACRSSSFAPEALLGMDALIPREKSIVDVLTLDRLGADAADTLAGAAQAGRRPRRARRRAAALAGLRADRRAHRSPSPRSRGTSSTTPTCSTSRAPARA